MRGEGLFESEPGLEPTSEGVKDMSLERAFAERAGCGVPATGAGPGPVPTYLRVYVTSACPLRCPYCHNEGMGRHRGGDPPPADLDRWFRALAPLGVRKVKLVGGEPLARPDLAAVTAVARRRFPDADLSLITAGPTGPGPLAACFAAGLDRANVSVHGWSADAFRRCGGSPRQHALRRELLERLAGAGRPLKVNYVYTGPEVEGDLDGLLDWAANRPGVVVNVLDDLNRPDLSAGAVLSALARLRGPWAKRREEDDPDSLPVARLAWADGLRAEVKTGDLGGLHPWTACRGCPARARCREGIFALRLTPAGQVRLCMDRADLIFPLERALRDDPGTAPAALRDWIGRWRHDGSDPGAHRAARQRQDHAGTAPGRLAGVALPRRDRETAPRGAAGR